MTMILQIGTKYEDMKTLKQKLLCSIYLSTIILNYFHLTIIFSCYKFLHIIYIT